MRDLLIHIGYPKTATTFLQKNVYPHLNSYRYLGKDDELSDMSLKRYLNFIAWLAYGPEEDLIKAFKCFDDVIKEEEVRRYKNIDSEIPLFLSFEPFLGLILMPINYSVAVMTADPQLVFSRLAKFGKEYNYNIKLMLFDRNPKELMHSSYAQLYPFMMKAKPLCSLKSYLNSMLNLEYMQLNGKYFFKDELLKVLLNHFDKKNIFQFNYEEFFLRNNKDQIDSFKFLLHLDFDILSVLWKKENVRQKDKNVKIGHKRHWKKNNRNLIGSLKAAWSTFSINYYKHDKLKVFIKWDEECDDLFKEIEKKVRNTDDN
ncbi:MAG: hypothetical protein JW866_10190 [Ignavibacteriales bacterium]|nr:hypothetical protein [Ignavibacteriales bacterium]